MKADVPLYNSRIIHTWVEYLKAYYPRIDTASLLAYADIKSYELDDEGHWLTQSQINRFHDKLAQQTDNPEIAREVGRFSVKTRAAKTVAQYVLSFLSPQKAYSVVKKLNTNFTRAATLETRLINREQLEVKATLMPGVKENHYQCLYRLGILEAIAKLFTGKYPVVEHPRCLHRGDDHCLYLITLEQLPSFRWKKIRNYSFLVGFVVCALFVGLLPHAYRDTLVLLCLLVVAGLSLYVAHLEKKDLLFNIGQQGEAAGQLLEQINASYNNARLIQEIGQATSMILDIHKLLAFIMEALKNRLDFDRGMIMLANAKHTLLEYTIGYGYTQEQLEHIRGVEFHLDKPHSKGTFVIAFKKQIPFLINDIGEIVNEISPKSVEFAKKMGTHSFICVPIVFKEEPLGILVVDNVRSKRILRQSDMSLLMGIAPQIAISIRNAISYRKITESEERFRSFSEYAPDIIYNLDAYGSFTYVNPAWERILGHRTEEVVRKELTSFVPEAQAPLLEDLFRKVAVHHETIQDVIVTFLHRDGSDRFLSISAAPNIDPEGRLIGMVGTLKDVTDLKLSEAKLKESVATIQSALDSTIQTISKIVESRDPYTAGHQERVAKLAVAIAARMGLSEDLIASIRMAATLHDVGKINVPAEILSRPRLLNDVEMGMIRMHPETGYHILASIEFPYPVARIVLQHHEKMDGSGYPAGLKGENILMEARILAVADVVEAMATHRPYRPALGLDQTLEEISQYRGTRYDPRVVDTCIDLFTQQHYTL